MEAQGIEPWSEPASSTASTCVGRSLGVAPGRLSANLPETNLRESHPPRRRTAEGQPGFAIRVRRPGRAPLPKVASASRAQLRQPAPNQSWQLQVSKRFNQEPGPGHAAIPSTDPSKPVAPPLGEKMTSTLTASSPENKNLGSNSIMSSDRLPPLDL